MVINQNQYKNIGLCYTHLTQVSNCTNFIDLHTIIKNKNYGVSYNVRVLID